MCMHCAIFLRTGLLGPLGVISSQISRSACNVQQAVDTRSSRAREVAVAQAPKGKVLLPADACDDSAFADNATDATQ